MDVTATPYGMFLMGLGAAQFTFDSDSFKVMLTTSAYTPNIDTHEFKSDVTNEITGTGYTAGGKALTSVSWDYDSTNHRAVVSANNLLWTGVTFTTRRAVVYKDTGTAGTSRLIGYIDFGVDKSPASEDWQISFTNGVIRIKPA